jgi:Ni,Fe-hydrogenase III small subunit
VQSGPISTVIPAKVEAGGAPPEVISAGIEAEVHKLARQRNGERAAR